MYISLINFLYCPLFFFIFNFIYMPSSLWLAHYCISAKVRGFFSLGCRDLRLTERKPPHLPYNAECGAYLLLMRSYVPALHWVLCKKKKKKKKLRTQQRQRCQTPDDDQQPEQLPAQDTRFGEFTPHQLSLSRTDAVQTPNWVLRPSMELRHHQKNQPPSDVQSITRQHHRDTSIVRTSQPVNYFSHLYNYSSHHRESRGPWAIRCN